MWLQATEADSPEFPISVHSVHYVLHVLYFTGSSRQANPHPAACGEIFALQRAVGEKSSQSFNATSTVTKLVKVWILGELIWCVSLKPVTVFIMTFPFIRHFESSAERLTCSWFLGLKIRAAGKLKFLKWLKFKTCIMLNCEFDSNTSSSGGRTLWQSV